MKTIAGRFVAVTLPLAACVGVPAQLPPSQRYALNAEAVATALHADGLEVRPDQVRMTAPASAAVEYPALELFGADRLPDGRMRMRLRCHRVSDCIPFSVTIDRAVKAPAVSPQLASASTIELRTGIADRVANASVSPAIQPVSPAAAAPVVAANSNPVFFPVGAKLTLLMEDGHMHIHLPVIALDSSAVGHEVRVRTPDGKQTFRASVVDSATVRGIVE